jgi:hypothetical protein
LKLKLWDVSRNRLVTFREWRTNLNKAPGA